MKRLAFAIAVLFLLASCATLPVRPDPACPDNLVLLNGEEHPGLLLALRDGKIEYMMLSGEMRTFAQQDVLRVDLGRRVGDPDLNTLDDLNDPEVRELIATTPASDEYKVTIALDESRITLNDDGSQTTVWRRLVRINKRSGLGWANSTYSFNSSFAEAKVDFGYAIAPDGKISVLSTGAVKESALGDGRTDGSQRRQLQIAVPDAVVGGFVYFQFSYRAEPRPLRPFQTSRTLFFKVPTGTYRAIIDVPAATELNIVERKLGDLVSKSDRIADGRRVIIYEAMQLPIVQSEPMMPAWRTVTPYYFVVEKMTWRDFATAYRRGLEERIQPDNAVTAKALKLTAGKPPFEAAQALYTFVLREVRDNGVDLWSRDPLPKPPAQTLADNRGNEVDRTALLLALARVAGLSADWCFVAEWDDNYPIEQAPWPQALYTPALRFSLPEGTFWATLSNNNHVFGVLTNGYSDTLFVNVSAGDTGRTPPLTGERNYARYVYDIYVQPDGSARIVENHTLAGQYAYSARGMRHMEDQDIENAMTSIVRRYALRNRLIDFSVEGMHELSDPVIVHRTSQTPMLLVSSGGRLAMLRLLNLSHGEINRVHPQRLYPLERSGLTREVNIYRFHLPADMTVRQLPEPVSRTIPWATYRASWTLEDRLLQYEEETMYTDRTLGAEHFEDYEAFLRLRREQAEKVLILETE